MTCKYMVLNTLIFLSPTVARVSEGRESLEKKVVIVHLKFDGTKLHNFLIQTYFFEK